MSVGFLLSLTDSRNAWAYETDATQYHPLVYRDPTTGARDRASSAVVQKISDGKLKATQGFYLKETDLETTPAAGLLGADDNAMSGMSFTTIQGGLDDLYTSLSTMGAGTITTVTAGASITFLGDTVAVAVTATPVAAATKYVVAYTTGTQSINASTDTVVDFQAEISDTDSFHSPSSNISRFTAPTTGTYVMAYSVQFAAGAGTSQGRTHLVINGNAASSNEWPALEKQNLDGSNVSNINGAVVRTLNAGDYVEVYAFQDTSGALNIGSATLGIANTFYMALIPQGVASVTASGSFDRPSGTGGGGIVVQNPGGPEVELSLSDDVLTSLTLAADMVDTVTLGSAYLTGSNLGGPNATIDLATDTKTSVSLAHAAVTLSGTPDYITLSGQDIVRGTVDISDDTNLTAGDALTLTGDDIDFDGGTAPAGELGGTWASPTVDSTHSGSAHHSAVTLSGTPDYITLSGQDIVRGTVDISDDTNLTAGDGLTLTGDDIDFDDPYTPVDGTMNVTGRLSATAEIASSTTLRSQQVTGTAPLTVASTTKVANLNADLLDDTSIADIPVGGDLSGTVTTAAVGNDSHAHTGTTLSGIDISDDTNLAGDSEIVLTGDALSLASTIARDTELPVGANPTATVNGTATNGVATTFLRSDGAPPIANPLTPTGSPATQYFSGQVRSTGSVVTSTTLVSQQATGTAPLTVASTTAVTNLNADLLDGSHASAFQGVDATLTALAAYNTNGLLTQTAADTFTGRTITGTANLISVSNGDGVAGNPTITIVDPEVPADGTKNVTGSLTVSSALSGATAAVTGTSGNTLVVETSGLVYDATNNRVGKDIVAPIDDLHLHNLGTDVDIVLTHAGSGATGSDGLLVRFDSGFNAYFRNKEAGTVNIGASNANAITITSGNNVGIKDPSADYPLEILSTSNPQFVISNVDASKDATVGVDTSGDLAIISRATAGGGSTLSIGTTVDSSTTFTVTETRWKDWAADAKVGSTTFDEAGTARVWEHNASGGSIYTDIDGIIASFPIDYEAGTIITEIRVKWEGGTNDDGVIFALVKRDESGITTALTLVGATQTPTTSESPAVTTYDIPDETVSQNYSYSLQVASEVFIEATPPYESVIFAFGTKTSKRAY